MSNNHDKRDPSERVATGVKTALLVCVIGFIALAANRAIVAPGGASPVDSPNMPVMSAPYEHTPTLSAAQANSMPSASSETEDGDNHPPTF